MRRDQLLTTSMTSLPLKLQAQIEHWPLAAPFRISGYTFDVIDVLLVTVESSQGVGRGEAAGVYYRSDDAPTMLRQIESLRRRIEAGITRDVVQDVLPAGGARNALDCALWDLEAKVSGHPAWQTAQIESPKPLRTTFTCGADHPDRMAAAACAYRNSRAIKLKLTGEPADAARVRAVRAARPDVWLGVDANQAFSLDSFWQLMPAFLEARVALIEQPFPIGRDALLTGFQSPIPIAADESAQSLADLPKLVGRFDVINIKLDKCGGLTEALAMTRTARALGLDTMVGNMMGTSLAMAPAFLLGQLCSVVDLDGPIFLKADRENSVQYADGFISCPESLWGHANKSG